MKRYLRTTLTRTHGFSLIENLIVALIMAAALSALAASQLNNIRSTKNAYLQSQAGNIASAMIEKMRSNPTAITDYLVDSATYTCPTLAPSPFCFVSATAAQTCTPSELAASELYVALCGLNGDAKMAVSSRLPNGALNIQCIAADGSYGNDCSQQQAVVTVSWNEQALLQNLTSNNRQFELVGAF